MAGALKQTFLEAVRLTPDGIVAFLETPIPAAPTIGTPADVDAAILASGVLSKYLLDLFTPFAGLTPIELLLRIGQHNSVLESAMLAGLEYIEGSADGDTSENGEFSISSPQPGDIGQGVVYSASDIPFIAIVTKGTCTKMLIDTLTLLPADVVKTGVTMHEIDGKWRQYMNLTQGQYTVSMTATFETGDPVTHNVGFTVIPEP